MFRSLSKSDWLRGVGVAEVPACTGYLLHMLDSGVLVVIKAAREVRESRDGPIADGAMTTVLNQVRNQVKQENTQAILNSH